VDIQRLRNITTGKLHTKIEHIYEDLEKLTGASWLMTHMLPRAIKSVEPWLRDQNLEARFWNGAFDTTHTGEIDLPIPTGKDQEEFFSRFAAMPNPLKGKQVVAVVA